MGLVASWHVESSWTRDRTLVPTLIGRFLTTGEMRSWFLKFRIEIILFKSGDSIRQYQTVHEQSQHKNKVHSHLPTLKNMMPFSEEREVHAFSFFSFWYEWTVLSWIGRLHRPKLTETLYSQNVLDALPTSISPSPVVPSFFLGLMWFCGNWSTTSQSGVEWTKPVIPSHPLNCGDWSKGWCVNWADHTVIIGGFLGMLEQNCSLWHKKESIWPQKLWGAILGLGIEPVLGWSWHRKMERTQVFGISLKHWLKPHVKQPYLWIC